MGSRRRTGIETVRLYRHASSRTETPRICGGGSDATERPSEQAIGSHRIRSEPIVRGRAAVASPSMSGPLVVSRKRGLIGGGVAVPAGVQVANATGWHPGVQSVGGTVSGDHGACGDDAARLDGHVGKDHAAEAEPRSGPDPGPVRGSRRLPDVTGDRRDGMRS